MKSIINKFKIIDGEKFSLEDMPTDFSGDYKKEDTEALLASMIKETAAMQDALYADNRYALLIIFQAMDAAGKDGAISHTLSGLNPEGCEVFSFKQPSTEELDHDFLWRHYKALPEFGRIGVHNRSHYENVLITKVHPELLLQEKLPGIKDVKDVDKKFWKHRYESIRAFEKHLSENGTVIIKFFLNVSKAEQKQRFLQRIEDPEKNWKFSAADVYEREFWEDYMKAYEKAIQETSTESSPWYVLPADKKWFTRIAISTIILDTLKGLKLKYPVLPKEEKAKLEDAKKKLMGE
ncbi:polyphosphate kinase 2 family protein [Mucilaginibacter gotjawali]|uniref:Polyphosphate kinase 2 (PPK2) n=2 Tax=Mucilaginibacter gotjawali TaxID=1550579 RepID=A0A110B3C9_9SPHI|nr:polyphosphate kinase 2 family protein [Mucilaginibacter gotjawali]MBB3055703.1 PPK2 family polyphosphate:nucleotide phosphotransferase [Mucilaginibacter gotjawali]BAU54522.1 Polyphosphate kinase 2 (PPK2) [Mucilaginibacter gotjawali]